MLINQMDVSESTQSDGWRRQENPGGPAACLPASCRAPGRGSAGHRLPVTPAGLAHPGAPPNTLHEQARKRRPCGDPRDPQVSGWVWVRPAVWGGQDVLMSQRPLGRRKEGSKGSQRGN